MTDTPRIANRRPLPCAPMSTAAPGVAEAPEVVIRPPSRLSALDFGELWEHRELIYFLTKRELQIRYKQSFFGVSWALFQPLVLGFIFAFFIGKALTIPVEIDYAVYAVAGLVPWLFTAQAITNSASSLVQDSALISKVYFPRLALPIAKAASLLVDLVLAIGVVILLALAYGVEIQPEVVLVPAFLLLGVVTTFAAGALLAAINVKYRDVQLVVPMLVTMMLFISPIIYPTTELVEGNLIYLYAINPLVTVLDGMRWAMFGTTLPPDGAIVISIATALVLTVVALFYFKSTEHYFADLV